MEQQILNQKKLNCSWYIIRNIKKEKKIYSVNPINYDYYKKKFKSQDVSWLTVLASFEESHLINHGVKSSHIQATDVDCTTFNDLIRQYNLIN